MECLYMLQFLVASLFLNIIALPICYKLFPAMKDGGYVIGKSIGLYICGYVMWLLSSCHILKFNVFGVLISTILVLLICYGSIVFQVVKKNNRAFIEYLSKKKKNFIISEIIFVVLFVGFNWIFAHRIPGSDTERMMDLGFMNSMYITDYMPPMDMWAAGAPINYYYFGQYIMTFLTKLAFIPVGYGYTFGLYMITAWLFVAVYRLVQAITSSRVAGLLSSLAVTFAGNVHYIIFGWFVPIIWDVLQLQGEKPSYWFANSTRYIGYVPEVISDKTIHEFPSYSFIVGDLHAHVINLMVVVVILALLWSYLTHITNNFKKDMSLFRACINEYTVMLAFLLGICSMSNYWDLPIYYVVSGSVILFGIISKIGFNKIVPIYVGVSGIFIYLFNLFVALPFNLKFVKMVEGIGKVEHRTMLYQYLILWGFPVIMSAIFIIIVIKNKKYSEKILFVVLLCLCAFGLTIIPELVFVKDIYVEGFPRANTMFKLSYEAFVLFGVAIGCIISLIYSIANESDGVEAYKYKKTAIIASVIVLCLSTYTISALRSWISDYSKENFQGFDAAKTIRNNNINEIVAVEELMNNVQNSGIKQPVVLEADGDSYSNTCFVSVLTGYPTVLGWHTHEWLWHNSHSYMENRRIDVQNIYTGTDLNQTKQLIEKYGIDYIFIGENEYNKYQIVENGLLEELGEVIYYEMSPAGQMIEIIKIDR